MENSISWDWMGYWSEINPDKVAVITASNHNKYTYKNISDQADKIASYLTSLGLKKGARIAFIADNSIEHIFLFAVACRMGIVLVPLNYRLTSMEIDRLLSVTNPDIFLYHDKYGDIANHFSSAISFSDFFSQANNTTASEIISSPISEEDPVFILFTSGTSGQPKGVLYTYKMMFWNSLTTRLRLALTPETKTVNCMPLFHTGGWNVLLTPILHGGGTVILTERFDAKETLDLLSEYQCTLFMGVPTMLKRMADLPDFKGYDLSHILYFIVGGEAMDVPLIEFFQSHGIPIRQGYGMTEVGPNLTSLNDSDAIRKKGSIGKPNMYVKAKLVDENGQTVSSNTPGELLLSGPMMSPGYLTRDSMIVPLSKEGWYATGDILIQDDEGYFYVVDRIKNMYISGGENVYPSEIESAIKEFYPQLNFAVVGIPDDRWGETGVAAISSEHMVDFVQNDLEKYLEKRLSKFKRPSHYVGIKNIPYTESGKIDRKVLKAEVMKRMNADK